MSVPLVSVANWNFCTFFILRGSRYLTNIYRNSLLPTYRFFSFFFFLYAKISRAFGTPSTVTRNDPDFQLCCLKNDFWKPTEQESDTPSVPAPFPAWSGAPAARISHNHRILKSGAVFSPMKGQPHRCSFTLHETAQSGVSLSCSVDLYSTT